MTDRDSGSSGGKENSSLAAKTPLRTDRPAATATSYKRRQRVLVKSGAGVFAGSGARASFATGGRVVSRKEWRRGWYGVELNGGAVVSVHASAMVAL